MAKVQRLPVGPLQVNCYIVSEGEDCVIVDPGDEAERIIAAASVYRPRAVLLTHAHFDHIGAVDAVCDAFGIPLYVHEADAGKLVDPRINVSGLFGQPAAQTTKPNLLHGGEVLTFGALTLEVMHTPGHTSGCVCYLLPDAEGILTGDTLFAHGYGRTDFPDGDFEKLTRSLRALYRLTPKRIAYPGHEGTGFAGHNPERNA